MSAETLPFYLRLTAATLKTLVKEGHIPYWRLGNTYLFLITKLEAWLDGLPGVSVQEAVARMREPKPAAAKPEPPMTVLKAQTGGK